MKIRVADYIANFLVENNINDIFVLTGYGAMYLNDAIAAKKELHYYCARNEAASPMMAEAYARVKGSVGAVCLTSGPGSTNAIPGLAEAWVDSAPVLIISGQVHKKHTTYNTHIPGLRTLGTAEINIVPIVKPITKYAVMINNPREIKFHLEKALFLAKNGRPGPVWLDIPHDVQSAMIEPDKLKSFKVPKQKKQEGKFKIEQVMKLLLASKKPIIVAGHGIRQSNAIEDFKNLVDRLQVPVVLTRLGVDLLSYSHEFNMGLGGIKGTRYSLKILQSADLVIVLGARLAIPFVGLNREAFSGKTKIIVVDIEKGELAKQNVKIDLKIHADVAIFIRKFMQKLSGNSFPEWKVWTTACKKLKKNNPMITGGMKRNPIDLYYFISRLDAVSGKNNILVTDAGSNYYVGGQVFNFEECKREITSATFAAMGLSIPLAIGASIAEKKFQILAITGDGSLELNIQELKTMSYYNLNIKLFVIDNNGYLSMRKWQDTYFEGRRIGSDDDTGAETLNLKRVAVAFDLEYHIISDWKRIDENLKKIMQEKGPAFVEVVCDDRQEIVEPLT